MTLNSKGKIPIAVVGSSSMVGSRFCELAKDDFNLIEADLGGKIPIDIINHQSVVEFFESHDFEWLILFSAFTDVDAAEKQRNKKDGNCWQVNVKGTKNVAAACRKHQKKLVYFSSDFIFDGKNGPYHEEDKPAKKAREISWYGWTKLKGEEAILDSGCQYLIARISYPYRAKFTAKVDFVRNIITRLKNRTLYPMFVDQFLTPTFIDDLAMALRQLIKSGEMGIYNLVDNTTLSAYSAACDIAQAFGFDYNQIKKGRRSDFAKANPHAAPRPNLGGLLATKINLKLLECGRIMRTFEESLSELKKQMGEIQ